MVDLEVVIVGCGPSGMVIAHACEQMGVLCKVYAPKVKSFISGAQYLHSDIFVRADGVRPKTVSYIYRGTGYSYEKKIYRKLPEGLTTSWDRFKGDVEAWPLIDIYDHLWEKHNDEIVDRSVSADWMANEARAGKLVFNTAPLNNLVTRGTFKSERVAIVTGICFADPNCIVYNGEPKCPWYRSSNLWGHMSIEYPNGADIPGDISSRFPVKIFTKPLMALNARIPGVIASGRYGRWEKGVLVDESYHQAIAEIKARL